MTTGSGCKMDTGKPDGRTRHDEDPGTDVLVTGAAGKVGRAVVLVLRSPTVRSGRC
jgi:NADPH:quinone reductase-like Zn-dependent oxidoreductase